MHEEVIGSFREFHEHNRFVESLNSTFLALIPKTKCVVDLKDINTIGLVDSVYKILAKVLANRVKKVVELVVSSS